MILSISNKSGIIERGVYCFGLSDYPHIKPLELKKLVAFIMYEKSYGRQTEIVCEDDSIIAVLNNAVAHPETVENIPLPEKLGNGNCSCIHRVCLTEFNGVRPSEGRKGYATMMLKLALDHCKEIGLEKVLLTCDKTNIASSKTIMHCGGKFETELIQDDGELQQRYWITL